MALLATEGVEGLALLETNPAAVRDCQAAHAQAPVELDVQRNVACRATEGSVIGQVFRKCLPVLGEILCNKKIYGENKRL